MAKFIGVLLFWASLFGAIGSYFPDVIGSKEMAVGKHIRKGYMCDDTSNIDCFLDRETLAKVLDITETGEDTARALVHYQIPLITTHEYQNADPDNLVNRRLVYTDAQVTFSLQKTRLGWEVINDVLKNDNKAFSRAYSNRQVRSYELSGGMDHLTHRLDVKLMQYFDVDGESKDIYIMWFIVLAILLVYTVLGFKGRQVGTEILAFSVLLSILSLSPIIFDRLVFF